jgi:DNA-binding NarL/FixJ family response regulator
VAQYLAEGMQTSWIAHKLNRKVSTISTIKSNIFHKLQIDNILKLREQIGLIGVKRRK